jgi:hypothetical protein
MPFVLRRAEYSLSNVFASRNIGRFHHQPERIPLDETALIQLKEDGPRFVCLWFPTGFGTGLPRWHPV